MSDNKKYYYIRLKDNFFDSNEIVLLESMPDGYLYSNILLKLYLRSLKDNGKLMFNERIPYNSQMIAAITRHQVGTVEKALNIFQEMGLIEVLDNGAIYMLDIQNFIGSSSSEADRRREYDRQITSEKKLLCEKSPRNLREIDTRDRDRDRVRDIDKDINKYMDLVHDVIEYLNQVTGKRYSDTSKDTIKLIKARAKEKYTIEDFKQVIDYKSKEWLNTEMDKYLRPATLFSTNFGRYLEDSKQPVKTIKKKVQKDVELPDWYDNYKNREEDKADDHISTDGFAYFKGE